MTTAVLKWNVPVDDEWHSIGGGQVTHVACQYGPDVVQVWTVEEMNGTVPTPRRVRVIGTGHWFDPADTVLGSAITVNGEFWSGTSSSPPPKMYMADSAQQDVTLGIDTLAYVAGVIDLLGIIRTRMAGGTELPYVALSGSNTGMLAYLDQITGTRSVVTRRAYSKAGCSQHCREKHQHVQSVSGRWSLSGAKATVLLWNIKPYLRLQIDEAVAAIGVGIRAPFKPATLTKMQSLGWHIPVWEDASVTPIRRTQNA